MTVILKRTDCQGDIKEYRNIKMIIDDGTRYILYINENWQIIASKKNNKIINAE